MCVWVCVRARSTCSRSLVLCCFVPFRPAAPLTCQSAQSGGSQARHALIGLDAADESQLSAQRSPLAHSPTRLAYLLQPPRDFAENKARQRALGLCKCCLRQRGLLLSSTVDFDVKVEPILPEKIESRSVKRENGWTLLRANRSAEKARLSS